MLLRARRCCVSAARISRSCLYPCAAAGSPFGTRCFRATAVPRDDDSTSSTTAKRNHRSGISTGTIVVHDALANDPHGILSKLRALPPARFGDRLGHRAIFILSKSFAGLADDRSFLGQAISKLFGSVNKGSSLDVHALVAVVDRIPVTESIRRGKHGNDGARDIDSVDGEGLPTTGFEGLAYLADGSGKFWSRFKIARGEQPISPPAPRSQGSMAESTSILSLQMQAGHGEQQSTATVEIPLADTLFVNGRRCTLLDSQWHRGQHDDEFDQVESYAHSQVLVSLAENPAQSGGLENEDLATDAASLSLPLAALTPLRRVTESMGNVIRKVEAESEVGASHELEQSIADYFTTHDIPPQAVTVWAISVPECIYNTGVLDSTPSQLLWMGATLHRVLSGGGGWGKKAGLISLDPDLEFASRSSDSEIEFVDLAGDHPNRVGGNIAQPGDYLGFYLVDPTSTPPHDPQMEEEPSHLQDDISVVLGVDRPMHDEMNMNQQPRPSADEAGQGESNSIEHLSNHFGALSERGISLHRGYPNSSSGAFQTKIDVPFARLTFNLSLPETSKASLESGPGARSSSTQKRTFHTTRVVRANETASGPMKIEELGQREGAVGDAEEVRRTLVEPEDVTREEQAPSRMNRSVPRGSDISAAEHDIPGKRDFVVRYRSFSSSEHQYNAVDASKGNESSSELPSTALAENFDADERPQGLRLKQIVIHPPAELEAGEHKFGSKVRKVESSDPPVLRIGVEGPPAPITRRVRTEKDRQEEPRAASLIRGVRAGDRISLSALKVERVNEARRLMGYSALREEKAVKTEKLHRARLTQVRDNGFKDLFEEVKNFDEERLRAYIRGA